jgi:WD40 repeat protein
MRLRISILILFLSFFGILGNVYGQYNFNVIRTFGETNHKIVFASYNSDGTYIITAGSDSSIILWNADRRTIYRTLTGLKVRPDAALLSADNEYVLSGGKDNKVSMWDLGTMPPKIMKTFEGYSGPIKSIDVSPDGLYMATGSANGMIKVWDLKSSNLVYDLKGHNKNKDVNTVAFSPDGRTLASGGDDGIIILWNIENGIMIGSQPAQKNGIHQVAFSPDGKLLASCGYDNEIIICGLPGLNNELILKGHKDWVQTIDFSPDSKNLISGGRDECIILWDVSTGSILHKSEKQGYVVLSLDFSPVRPDFISAGYNSENIETWALSGMDETQWKKPAIINTKTSTTDIFLTDNQQRAAQEQALSNISQSNELLRNNSMIEIFSPVHEQGRIVHDKTSLDLIGRVSDPQGINTFLINRSVIKLSEGGVFQFNTNLKKGENILDLVAINNKGIMNEQRLVIDCTAEEATDQGMEIPEISKGKYFALLIGINDYQYDEITDLDNPIKDAESLYNVLLTRYTFEKDNITFLKNPTQGEIIMTLDELGRKLTTNDNLLIFYAGHGYWDDKGKVGYWFPSDASKNSTVNWFRNSTLRDFIGSIGTRHTILIADACFSGAIFKSRAAFTDTPQGIQKLYELPSRKAMTSGILQEVPDESVFIKYLVNRLNENEEKYLSSEVLFSSFKTAVMNNSSNVPQYGIIQNVGDEGGDFIFIKR